MSTGLRSSRMKVRILLATLKNFRARRLTGRHPACTRTMRVRFPPRSIDRFAPVAQPVEARDRESRKCRFESCSEHSVRRAAPYKRGRSSPTAEAAVSRTVLCRFESCLRHERKIVWVRFSGPQIKRMCLMSSGSSSEDGSGNGGLA